MYLKEILLENIASIKFLNLTLPLNSDNIPKPIVFVGVNGSGKSIVLSYIADALFEFANTSFTDMVPSRTETSYPYFKLNQLSNKSTDSEFGIGLLEFFDFNLNQKYYYTEKTGKLEANSYISKLNGKFTSVSLWDTIANHKKIEPINKDFFKECFWNNVFCYFPSNRREIPHWLNTKSIVAEPAFTFREYTAGKLNKPIYIESCIKENKSWILDVCLDSSFELNVFASSKPIPENGVLPLEFSIKESQNLAIKMGCQQARRNIEFLLKEIFQDQKAELVINHRNVMHARLGIIKNNNTLIPSLDHLSSGQSILFNLFTTIIRYADRAEIYKSVDLKHIEGIVLIDEIDAHLHSDLQYEILPKMLKLFPKIQFIVTTHSPLFILGMEKEYGSDGFQIIELPEGSQITTERFSEFKKSFEYYKETKSFIDELKYEIVNKEKPLVFVAGKTDKIYIETAFEVLGRSDLLEKLEVQWIGREIDKGKEEFTGDSNLNHALSMCKANQNLLSRKILFLCDCDYNKPDDIINNIFIRRIKKITGTLCRKGIENLIPQELRNDPRYERSRFYTQIENEYGEFHENLLKVELANWLCTEIKENKYFVNFQAIIDIVGEFLDKT